MERSENINELALALTKAQAEMGGAVMDSDNPFFKSKYADLGSIIRVIKPPFAKHGLSYSQFPITSEDRIGVETVIVHESGQFISNEFTMRVPKADPQSAGGVISYCRRYALQAVCGIPAVDSDGEEYMQRAREEESQKISSDDIFEQTESRIELKTWRDVVLEVGQHEGKKLGEVPTDYIKFLIGHAEAGKIKNAELEKAVNEAGRELNGNGKQGFEQVG